MRSFRSWKRAEAATRPRRRPRGERKRNTERRKLQKPNGPSVKNVSAKKRWRRLALKKLATWPRWRRRGEQMRNADRAKPPRPSTSHAWNESDKRRSRRHAAKRRVDRLSRRVERRRIAASKQQRKPKASGAKSARSDKPTKRPRNQTEQPQGAWREVIVTACQGLHSVGLLIPPFEAEVLKEVRKYTKINKFHDEEIIAIDRYNRNIVAIGVKGLHWFNCWYNLTRYPESIYWSSLRNVEPRIGSASVILGSGRLKIQQGNVDRHKLFDLIVPPQISSLIAYDRRLISKKSHSATILAPAHSRGTREYCTVAMRYGAKFGWMLRPAEVAKITGKPSLRGLPCPLNTGRSPP